MIDEDLYQQAADELNSDKRRPHIWARACALASDDHDEARYLYTNLRVEELMAEREAAAPQTPAGPAAADADDGDFSLALEPLDDDSDTPASVSTPSGIDQDLDPDAVPLTLNSAVSGSDDIDNPVQSRNFSDSFDQASDEQGSFDDLGEHDDYLDDTINVTSELDGTAVFELDKADAPDLDESTLEQNEPASLTAATGISAEEELEALLDGVYEGPEPTVQPASASLSGVDDTQSAETAEFSDVSGVHDTREEDLDWLEQELSASDSSALSLANTGSSEDDADLTLRDIENTDQLAEELERQAGTLPGQQSDVIDPDALPGLAMETLDADAGVSHSEAREGHAASDSSGDGDKASGLDSIFDSIEQEAGVLSGESATETASQSSKQTGVDADPDGLSLSTDDKAAFSSEPDIALTDPSDRLDDARDLDDDIARDTDSDHRLPAAAVVAASGTAAGITSARLTNDASAAEVPRSGMGDGAPRATASHGAAGTGSVPIGYPVDLTDNSDSGAVHSVYRRDQQARAVRHGVSWPALVVTLPWLLYRHLFGTAIVYSLTWLILIAGLLVSGLAWLDSGSAASVFVKGATIGFGLLAIIGLLYLPFRHANKWRRDRLEQRGFEPVALVRDRSAGKAIAQARKASLLD